MKQKPKYANPEFRALLDLVTGRPPKAGKEYPVTLEKLRVSIKKYLSSQFRFAGENNQSIERVVKLLEADPTIKKPFSGPGLALYTTLAYNEMMEIHVRDTFMMNILYSMVFDLAKQINRSRKGELPRKVRVAFTSPTLINKILDKAVDKYYSEFREESLKKFCPYVG